MKLPESTTEKCVKEVLQMLDTFKGKFFVKINPENIRLDINEKAASLNNTGKTVLLKLYAPETQQHLNDWAECITKAYDELALNEDREAWMCKNPDWYERFQYMAENKQQTN